MTIVRKPRVVVLGSNFGGFTTARFLKKELKNEIDLTVIDQKDYLLFVPNIPETTMKNENPQYTMQLDLVKFYKEDGARFIQATVTGIDVDAQTVTYLPDVRPGAAPQVMEYDYLVVATGCRLAYDDIKGFGQYGMTVSDVYNANKLRRYLFDGGYQGGPIAIGSARFHQGTTGRPAWLPTLLAACEGPVMEMSMLLGNWLKKSQGMKDCSLIKMFTPGEVLGDDAGKKLAEEFAKLAEGMGMSIQYNTYDIKEITHDGVDFVNGPSLEAEVKIIFPDWKTHKFLQGLPVSDDMGFILTDKRMRNQKYPNVFAVGDCAALTVPKLGAIGDAESRVVVHQIGQDLGKDLKDYPAEFDPMVICWGTMNDDTAFYLHSNLFYGGNVGYLKIGHTYYMMKMAFRDMYYATGGMPPHWGLPLAEVVGDHI